jgi:signal transduction histidine kinase
VRDLSLHILDLAENALRAGAGIVAVTLEADEARDLLTLAVEDDGPGLPVPPEVAADPFFTTQEGKRVGLGLSLMKGAAERAGGTVVIGPSALGGVAVKASMGLSHIDRSPLGDLAATFAALVCTHPEIDFRFTLRRGPREEILRPREVARSLPDAAAHPLALAARVSEIAKKALQNLTF